MTDHTILHINCSAEQKQQWMHTARIEGVEFEDWVRAKLNSHIIDANPPWLHGLSERTRICLLGAGFKNRYSITQALHNPDYCWSAISNFGPKCKAELELWINE